MSEILSDHITTSSHVFREGNILMLHLNIRAQLNRSHLLSKTLINMGLLDELVSGFLFVGLPLVREQLGLSYEQSGLLFTGGACSGMILGPILSLLSDRSSKRYALLTLVAVIGFLSIRSTWFAPCWLFMIGFAASGLYPIAKAEAYNRQPGRSGTVRAIINLGAPFEVN